MLFHYLHVPAETFNTNPDVDSSLSSHTGRLEVLNGEERGGTQKKRQRQQAPPPQLPSIESEI